MLGITRNTTEYFIEICYFSNQELFSSQGVLGIQIVEMLSINTDFVSKLDFLKIDLNKGGVEIKKLFFFKKNPIINKNKQTCIQYVIE